MPLRRRPVNKNFGEEEAEEFNGDDEDRSTEFDDDGDKELHDLLQDGLKTPPVQQDPLTEAVKTPDATITKPDTKPPIEEPILPDVAAAQALILRLEQEQMFIREGTTVQLYDIAFTNQYKTRQEGLTRHSGLSDTDARTQFAFIGQLIEAPPDGTKDEFPWNMLNGDGFVWTINPSVYPSFNEKFTCAMRFIRDERFDPTGAFDPIAFVEFCKQVDTKVCEHAAKGQTPCKELQASYYNAHSDESESTKPNFVDYLKDIKKHFFTIKEGE